MPEDIPRYPVAVDICLYTIVDGRLHVLMIERGAEPHGLAFPGGLIQPDENAEDAARRELLEETSVELRAPLIQLGAYTEPDRDPRGRAISIAFVCVAHEVPVPVGGSDAASATLLDVEQAQRSALAFDHSRLLADSLERVRTLLEETTIATGFLQVPFTMSQLRRVYEIVWGVDLDPGGFDRRVRERGFLERLDSFVDPSPAGGRPARLYQPGCEIDIEPPLRRPRDHERV